jgi:hypothetical protein
VVKWIAGPGNVIGGGTPEQFASFVAGERARWTEVVKEKNIRAD